jgi:transcriptional regulator with XRE-family HTH domain
MTTAITPAAVRATMARLGLTQQRLAEAVGADQGNVSRWLSGKATPRAEHAARLADLISGAEGLAEVAAGNEAAYAWEGQTAGLRAAERAEVLGYPPLELWWVGAAWWARGEGRSAAEWTLSVVEAGPRRQDRLYAAIERMERDELWPWP